MSYDPDIFVDDNPPTTVGTKITAARMNKIGQGISDAHDMAASAPAGPGVVRTDALKAVRAEDYVSSNGYHIVTVAAGGAWIEGPGGALVYAEHPGHTDPEGLSLPGLSTTDRSRLDQVVFTPNGLFSVAGTEQVGVSTVTYDARQGAATDADIDALFPDGWVHLADAVVRRATLSAWNIEAPVRDRRRWAVGAGPWRTVGGGGNPPFLNGWASMAGWSTVAFRLTSWGTVEMKGMATAVAANNAIAWIMPLGYRPSATVALTGKYWNGSSYSISDIIVDSTATAAPGQVRIYGLADAFVARDYFSLEMLSYTVED